MPNYRPKPRHHPLYGFRITQRNYNATLSCRARQCRWQFQISEEEDLENLLAEMITHRMQCNLPILPRRGLASTLSSITVDLPKPGNSS